METTGTRWEQTYQTKSDEETSWYEARPQVSLDLIAATGCGTDATIVDIGAGSSRLLACLLDLGFRKITVLDLSPTALAKARAAVAEGSGSQSTSERTSEVEWVVRDVLDWRPSRRFDIWHDRAAFHFLTHPADQEAYLKVMDRALLPGGHCIIGTFAPDGPAECSGLPVARYDAESLSKRLGPGYQLLISRIHDHQTPWGSPQRFHFGLFRKR